MCVDLKHGKNRGVHSARCFTGSVEDGDVTRQGNEVGSLGRQVGGEGDDCPLSSLKLHKMGFAKTPCTGT